ncbi:MAG: hypothetical protein R3343_14695 [Nitriliruptorales bacterium]|nr:hypothetical protein [Nitriliruptorales bacterium]
MARETEKRSNEPVEREREVIVTDRDSSSGVGAVVAAIIGIIVVGLIAWFLFAGFGGDTDSAELNVDVENPAEQVEDGGGDSGGGS